MKVSILESNGKYSYANFSMYLPTFKWMRKQAGDIGEERSENTIKMPTEFTVVNTPTSSEIIIRILGLGIGLYVKEIR